MWPIVGTLIGLVAFGCFIWLVWPNRSKPVAHRDDEVIDAENAQQIGFLVGLVGGNIADAAVARFALRRFEETHGRKATMRDAAIVVGLMKSQQ